MTMQILKIGLILGALVAIGGCTAQRTSYSSPPAIVQQTPVTTAPYMQATPPIQVQTVPPGATVVPGTPACPNCPPPNPAPFVPH